LLKKKEACKLMMLEGKVAVIVGGEGPLARAITKRFLSEGARLVLAWNSPEEWQEAKGLIGDEYKEQYMDISLDATKEDQVEDLMKKAKEKFGKIDILLHTVGLFFAGPLVWETDVQKFDTLIEVNLKTAFLSTKHAVRYMLEKGQGRIVYFPAAGILNPPARQGVYSVSKTGLTALMLTLREELKDTGITVNCVMPSIMDTPKTRKMPNAEPDKWVKPPEVANLLCSLCSDDSNALSGSMLKVLGKL